MKKIELSIPPAPSTLSSEAAGHWDRIVGEWDLSEPGLILLRSALESFDRAAQAREILAREGMAITDRFNQPKPHPMCGVERDARASLLQALKSLGLDAPQLSTQGGMPPGGANRA